MLADIVWDQNTLSVVFGCAIPIVTVVAFFWYKVAKVRSHSAIKRRMIERGMSVDEIERVLNAGGWKG